MFRHWQVDIEKISISFKKINVLQGITYVRYKNNHEGEWRWCKVEKENIASIFAGFDRITVLLARPPFSLWNWSAKQFCPFLGRIAIRFCRLIWAQNHVSGSDSVFRFPLMSGGSHRYALWEQVILGSLTALFHFVHVIWFTPRFISI